MEFVLSDIILRTYSVQYKLPIQRGRAETLGGTGSNASISGEKIRDHGDHVEMQPAYIQHHFLNQESSDNLNISSDAKFTNRDRVYITYQIPRADTAFICRSTSHYET